MKKTTKRITCAALAVSAAAALAVAAFAADYASAPSFSDTPSQSTTVTSGELNSAIDSAKENAEGIPVAVIEAASTNNITLSATVMKKLAEKEDVILSIRTDEVIIEIDGYSITNTKKVNLSMDIENTSNKTVIDFVSSADFGCEVKVIVLNCKLSADKLEEAHVYCGGEDLGYVEINDDGNPVITVTAGGKYEIR